MVGPIKPDGVAIGENVRSEAHEGQSHRYRFMNGLPQFRVLRRLASGWGCRDRRLSRKREKLDGLRYCGSPTFRTSSANRGSERMGSSKKSVFNLCSK